MPPISNRETIPNFPLNGYELAIYAVKVFEQECELRDLLCLVREPAVRALKQALENDWVFKMQFIYPNVSFEMALQTHVTRNHEVKTAFTLDLLFRFPNNASFPESKPFVRRPVSCSAPPLESFSPDAGHVVDCFTIAVKVENPNLVRVHCGMPITVTEKVPPKHGEMFGQIKNHELTYDPAGYESLPDPVVTDQTLHFVKLWNLPLPLPGDPISLRDVGKDIRANEFWGNRSGFLDAPHKPIDEQELVAHVDLLDYSTGPATANPPINLHPEMLSGFVEIVKPTVEALAEEINKRQVQHNPALRHQPIDKLELVAHVDLQGAEIELERATANRGGEIEHFPESNPPDATTGAETPGTAYVSGSMVREIAKLPFVAESDRIASELAEVKASEADLAQKRATTNPDDGSAANHGKESTSGVDATETTGNGIVAKGPVSKRDRKRFR